MKLSDFPVVRWVCSQNSLQLAVTATFHQPLLDTWLLTPENVCTGFLNKSVETRRRKVSVKTTVLSDRWKLLQNEGMFPVWVRWRRQIQPRKHLHTCPASACVWDWALTGQVLGGRSMVWGLWPSFQSSWWSDGWVGTQPVFMNKYESCPAAGLVVTFCLRATWFDETLSQWWSWV